MGSFVENVNKLSLNLDTIVTANSMFDDSVLPVLQEIADLDLQEVTEDLKKGNYLGNRKIDIALSLNNTSTTTSVSYSGVTILLTSGVSLSMPFLNGEGNPLELTSHADIKNYIANHELYAQVLSTELTIEESVGTTPTLIRFRDADGGSSNVERVELSVYLGDAVNLRPTYFWAQTTSSLQTIANRVGDIIALGNDIDSIVQLSSEIDSMLDLQNNLPELNTLHANLAEILLIDDKTAQVLGYKADAEASALSASQNAGLAEGYKNTAQIAATTATQKSDEIKAITAEALTGTAGAPASVAYNNSTGKFSFYIPQGLKGDKGDAFTVNATGTFAQRVNYNTQPTGFSFLATDTSMIYFKNSATSGDWSAGSAFGKGDKGDTGDDGRSVLSISRTAGTGTSGTTDTYTITYSDASTSTFNVYNGLDSNVESVNGRVGAVVLAKADVGLTNVDNTSDANKPVSTAMQTQLDAKANNDKSINIGTTTMTLDRASASQSLTGVSIDGNAGTATKLATARTINGVSFDGSASINIEDRLGTAIASAATTTLGSSSSGDTIHITGTTAITSFGASVTGVKKTLIFDAALTLTHNGTSLILPASTNIVTVAGDTADFVCENGASGNWRCIGYTRASISITELGYLDGVTSAIQTQISGKANINDNTTGSSGSCTGNSATATSASKLTTARTINGVYFDGSTNITIPTGGSTNYGDIGTYVIAAENVFRTNLENLPNVLVAGSSLIRSESSITTAGLNAYSSMYVASTGYVSLGLLGTWRRLTRSFSTSDKSSPINLYVRVA